MNRKQTSYNVVLHGTDTSLEMAKRELIDDYIKQVEKKITMSGLPKHSQVNALHDILSFYCKVN